MDPGDSSDRPRAVTAIGWTSLVIAALFVARALIDLVIWRIMRPAIPALLASSAGGNPAPEYLRPLLEHLTELKVAQVIFWASVAVCAAGLLRMRSWARVAMQAACGILAAYCVAIALVLVRAWVRIPAGDRRVGELSESHRVMAFSAVLCLCALLASGLVGLVFLLRSARAKEAFARSAAAPVE